MADKKISQLTAASLPLAGTEVLPIVQSSATVKVSSNDLTVKNVRSNATTGILQIAGPAAAATRTMTVPDANFTAARTDAANSFTADQTFATGNLIQGTAAKGINFTANTPAAGMTSQLLNWYEEGTFTPAIEGETTNPTVGYSTQYGAYTRIGRMVNFSIRLTLSSLSGGSGNVKIVGLPFTAGLANNPYACAMEVSGVTFGAGLTAISYRPLSGQTWGRLNQFGSGAAAAATTIAQLSSTADIIISGAYMV